MFARPLSDIRHCLHHAGVWRCRRRFKGQSSLITRLWLDERTNGEDELDVIHLYSIISQRHMNG